MAQSENEHRPKEAPEDELTMPNFNPSTGTTRVAFLGPPGTFTHQAVLQDWPTEQGYIHSSCETIRDVFIEVQQRASNFGIVPFENSTYGSVTNTMDLLAAHLADFPDVLVCGEQYVEVSHTLLGRTSGKLHQQGGTSSGFATPTKSDPSPQKPTSRPLNSLDHVKRLYSHPMAWGQCDAFLSTYLKGRERHDCSSTAAAAELVSKDETNSSASISCIAAATAKNLDVLARKIEDKPDNTTRFLTLYRTHGLKHGPIPGYLQPGSAGSSWRSPGLPWKSLLRFTVDHTQPGALADAMKVFSIYGLNLTSMNNRPSGQKKWHYIFFVEFMGRQGDASVTSALKMLREKVEHLKFMGSFKDRQGAN